MPQVQFLADCADPSFVAEQDDLRLGPELRPTGDGIPLDDGEVAFKRLGAGE